MACHLVKKETAMDLRPSDLTRHVNDMALVKEAIDKPISKHMTAGYLRLKAGYDRQLSTEYEEVNVFLEGTLTYTFDGKSFTAGPGDVVLIEQGSSKVHYHTDEGCLVFFVLYPQLKKRGE